MVEPIGRVQSSPVDLATAPKQGDEGAPEAYLVFDARVREGLRDIQPVAALLVLTWLDRAIGTYFRREKPILTSSKRVKDSPLVEFSARLSSIEAQKSPLVDFFESRGQAEMTSRARFEGM